MRAQAVRCSLVLSAVMVLVASSATADMTLRMYDSYGNTNGGEFLAKTLDGWDFEPVSLPTSLGGVDGSFETFCVERNEYFHIGGTYHVVLNNQAINGGVGGGNPDPLDSRTAYLYSQFLAGSLASYTYTGAGRVTSANALQRVIWGLEGEFGSAWAPPASSLQAIFLADAEANADDSLLGVGILNMFGDVNHTYFKQDQLIMVPEPKPIPAPTAAMLGSLGLITVGWWRRKKMS